MDSTTVTPAAPAALAAASSISHPYPMLEIQEISQTFNSKPRKKRTKLIRISDSLGSSSSTSITKPKYTKKPDPTAPKITRPCSECGKKFWSWKALFGHMRCHPERQWRGINPPPNFKQNHESPQIISDAFEDLMTEEDRHVANCLLMLANDPTEQKSVLGLQRMQKGCQKNVRGCFAINENKDDETGNYDDKMMMVLGHKCGICLRVFSSGQALGGHKRCHWDHKVDEQQQLSSSFSINPVISTNLNLNLPAPPQDYDSSSSYSSGLALDLTLGL